MLKLLVYCTAAIVVVGMVLSGVTPNSPASAVHDASVGWHWILHLVHAHAHIANK
jgi:hypothetical protein